MAGDADGPDQHPGPDPEPDRRRHPDPVGAPEPAAAGGTEPLLTWALLASGILHLAAVVGQQAFVYFDSGEYEVLDVSGRSRRPWVTPLLYELVADHGARIAVQGAIAAVCWGYLALQVARLAVDRRVQWALLLGVLAFSLTTTVTSWDTAMLSESLALSTTALLLGSLVRFTRLPTVRGALLVVLAWVPWIWTRHGHLVVGIVAVAALAALLAGLLLRRRPVRTSLALLVGGAALVTAAAGATYSRNTEILEHNLALVVGGRVLPDPERAEWYLDQGMPLPRGAEVGVGRAPEDLVVDARFREWLRRDGTFVYARDLLLHPWQTLTEPLESMVGDRPPYAAPTRPDEVMLAAPDAYGVGREVLPRQLEDLLFEPGNAGMAIFLLVVVGTGTVVEWRRRGFDRRWALPLLGLAVQVPALYAVWHASTIELGRHALPTALLVRILLWVQLGLLVDRRWRPEPPLEEAGGRATAAGATAP